MKSMIDIYDLLKRYGTFIYTGDRIGDLVLMEDEIRELYKSQVLDVKDFQTAILILRQEATKLKPKNK
ncbi:MAG TPA: YqgQ family protein [Ureibacillus sp.]|nr:YqgQ family protein [Ureibacillus sp.]